jgi:hypothetical protein
MKQSNATLYAFSLFILISACSTTTTPQPKEVAPAPEQGAAASTPKPANTNQTPTTIPTQEPIAPEKPAGETLVPIISDDTYQQLPVLKASSSLEELYFGGYYSMVEELYFWENYDMVEELYFWGGFGGGGIDQFLLPSEELPAVGWDKTRRSLGLCGFSPGEKLAVTLWTPAGEYAGTKLFVIEVPQYDDGIDAYTREGNVYASPFPIFVDQTPQGNFLEGVYCLPVEMWWLWPAGLFVGEWRVEVIFGSSTLQSGFSILPYAYERMLFFDGYADQYQNPFEPPTAPLEIHPGDEMLFYSFLDSDRSIIIEVCYAGNQEPGIIPPEDCSVVSQQTLQADRHGELWFRYLTQAWDKKGLYFVILYAGENQGTTQHFLLK